MLNSSQLDRIAKARMGVILSAPFFGSLLMRLQMVRDDSAPTFCTNGQVIRYNEQFAAGLTDAELRGVLVHEVCHCAQGHLWRQGQRHPAKWNHATDYQINGMLTTYVSEEKTAFETRYGSGRFVTPWDLPQGGLLDPAFAGMASEDIYNLLPDGSGDGAPSPGEFEEPAAHDDRTSMESDWKIAVTQAAAVARMRGQLPASLARLVGDLLEPKVPWRQVLREFVRHLARDDYSWARPNRRYLGSGFILPSLHSERMGPLAIAVDTSGSIDDHALAEFQAEIQATLDECAPESVEVIYCDAAINGTTEYRPGDLVRLQPQGGGGTDFVPVFDHLAEADRPPVALIYLTDGHGRFPDHEPEYPTLWASTASTDFPFGQLVSVK